MFYTGKSTACHTCRQRRLKCDEVRPHCLKCRRAGRQCLGYRDESAFIIRDMTTATIQKFEPKNESTASASVASGSASEKSKSPRAGSSQEVAKYPRDHATATSPSSLGGSFTSASEEDYWSGKDRRKVRKQRSIADYSRWKRKDPIVLEPLSVALPLEDRALCYFASRYAFAPTQYLDPGYLPVLKVVSQRKQPGPCLSCSLSAVSLAAFSTKLNARKTILKARLAYATALQMTNEAIQRPGSCQDDELLASVVLLALFEVFCSDGIVGWSSHIFGAAAMLGARGKVSFRDKLVRALFRVVSNESVKLHMMGFSSPHTGTEVWLRWLSDPRYVTYITPDAEAADPNADEIVDLSRTTEGLSLEDVASLKGSDALDQVTTGRAGTLPVPQTSPAPPVGYVGPQTDDETMHITQALNETKGMIQAYSMNQPPVPSLDEPNEEPNEEPIDFEQQGQASRKGKHITEVDRTYQKLAQISLYVAACTARLVTYNVMARLAASLSSRATEDYAEAVAMGRKEIREILRMAPHFFQLMRENGLTGAGDRASLASRGYESSSSSENSDSSSGSGDGKSVSARTQKQLPNLAKSYIGLMILWPIATAASTDLVDADQFKYIMGMLEYIIEVCGIRMGDGVRQFCVEKRELSGAPFFT
ncbi:putative Zn(2)-C6 fungal-type domain-containing protein [Seiridium cardinale]